MFPSDELGSESGRTAQSIGGPGRSGPARARLPERAVLRAQAARAVPGRGASSRIEGAQTTRRGGELTPFPAASVRLAPTQFHRAALAWGAVASSVTSHARASGCAAAPERSARSSRCQVSSPSLSRHTCTSEGASPGRCARKSTSNPSCVFTYETQKPRRWSSSSTAVSSDLPWCAATAALEERDQSGTTG
jgi:hypothetical protein